MVYIYKIGDSFLKINNKTISYCKVKNINRASFFDKKSTAKSWLRHILSKYPNAELKKAEIKLELKP